MTVINIVVVEDHEVVAEGLELMLNSVEEINVQARAATAQQAIELGRTYKPDIILSDIGLPGMTGLELIPELLAELPDTRIIMLTNNDEEQAIFDAIEAGASGYLLKTCSRKELVDALTAVHRGETILSPSVLSRVVGRISSKPAGDSKRQPLTDREAEILQTLALGLTNKEIASRLSVSENTIKTHVTRIIEKLDVRDRTQAVAHGIRDGLIKVEG